jgi:acetyl esterase
VDVKPEVRTILDAIESAAVPLAEQTPEGLREAYAALSAMSTKEDVASVSDHTIPGPGGDLQLRHYRPVTDAGNGETLPVLVWFHGGGWVIGNIETHDSLCRSLANAAQVAVTSVEYRLAPEHPFPAGLDDALAAIRWVAANGSTLGIDPERLAVGGDSAGGNLAAAACQRLRDAEPSVRFQLLVYPVLDARFATRSIDENAEGYFLTKEAMLWFREHYLSGGEGDPDDPRVSPGCAPESAMVGLPPGLVITAEYDPLRDEGEIYGERLQAAGVNMAVSRYDGVIHGFMAMADLIPDGRAAIDEAAKALRAVLA